MKIAVIGAGLSGCTMARLLKDRGHEVVIYEKEQGPGGLCSTAAYKGRLYQLFGPHNLHTYNASVIAFLCRFSKFNNYLHRVGTFIDGRILPYPVSYKTIGLLQEKDSILEEISRLPKEIDMSNFRNCVISMMGKSLYEKFIASYTFKFWGIDPEEMDAGWAPKRIEIRQDDNLGYFNDEWQGMPSGGYTRMFETMIEGIPVKYNTKIRNYCDLNSELIISTIPIDELFNFCYGPLSYRGLDFSVHFDECEWEDVRYGCINYPNSNVAFTRRCNYSLCYSDGPVSSYIVGYDFPGNNSRMYPVYTPANKKLFTQYLDRLVQIGNLLSIGRLGLFRYYDMDEAIEWCIDNINMVENYPELTPDKRMELLTKVK